MELVKIQQQTEAEKDQFLLESFYDSGIISHLLSSNYSIISGRKGTGKTALARFLENKHKNYGIDFAVRISVRDLSISHELKRNEREDSVLFYILVRVIQEFLKIDLLDGKEKKYWIDFLQQHNLQSIVNYESFVEFRRENSAGFSLRALFSFFGGETKVEGRREFQKATLPSTPHLLFDSLVTSIPDDKKVVIFVDDITDYLDEASNEELLEDIDLVKNVLTRLDSLNTIAVDKNRKLRLISLIREDLFEFMNGSNVNKLRSDALGLVWSEKDFASLLIKRLPFYKDSIDESLKDPITSLKKYFPDAIFSEIVDQFDTNRYHSNFYAYMSAISFNRPRDFLMYCYAMRNRLSMKHSVEKENIDSAETEYSDYFTREIRDELYLASKILKFKFDTDGLNRVIDILSKRNGFNSSQLKTELAQYLGEKTSLGNRKIESFIQELWWYGILGYKDENPKSIMHFRYLSNLPLIMDKLKSYTFFLHRGLWWFALKRKGTKFNQR